MWCCWKLSVLLCVSMATPAISQSGDRDRDWDSGLRVSMAILAANTSQEVGDQPAGTQTEAGVALTSLLSQPKADECSVNFHTNPAPAPPHKALNGQWAHLKAIQRDNQVVVENLVQYVGAEMGEQSYQGVIQENVLGIKEDHQSSHTVVQKAVDYLDSQLKGEVMEAVASKQTIKEESVAFEGMLGTAADIARRLEISSRVLHASFTKQLKGSLIVHG